MLKEDPEKYVKALVELHSGLARLGPGDTKFTNFIIDQIPGLPPHPRILDLGCGTGAGTLMLAKRFQTRVTAVDLSPEFLAQLVDRAKQQGLEDFVEAIECDIGNLGWNSESIDFLWSEGAAYNITFAAALEAWRPLLTDNGIAVISEMNYFIDEITEVLAQYMQHAYPDIKTEAQNLALIDAAGFDSLGSHRLPAAAWWENYYGPLRDNMNRLRHSDDKQMQAVISETEAEMRFFEQHESEFGYTYYILRAI